MQCVLYRWREDTLISWSGEHTEDGILYRIPELRNNIVIDSFFNWLSLILYQALQKSTLIVEYSQREVMTVLKTRSDASGKEPVDRITWNKTIFEN